MDSSIKVSQAATTFVGPDATELFRAVTIRSALRLLMNGITPRRGVTLTKTLKLVEKYTGRSYKRTEAAQALDDLKVWIETMKSAIPVDLQFADDRYNRVPPE